MKKMLLVCMAFMMIAILGCKNEPTRNEKSAPYEVNYYVDTISGCVILTTVCHNHDNTSLSSNSIMLGKLIKQILKSNS